MIKLSITQATCRVSKTADEHITAGMVGKVVHVDFADDWSDLVKVAVCSGSGATKDVVGWTDRFVIPSEVCKNAGSVLKIGIYGYRTLDEEVTFATPTVVANLGAIEPSLSPSGDTTTEASAEVWQQILSVAESKLADAPKDGKQYLRKDGSWEELGPDEETASRIEAIEAKEASWDSKAAGDHNHAGVYQPAGSYASATHNHAGVYQPVGDYANSNHNHSYNSLTDKPTIPEAYNDTALRNRVAAIETKESTWDGKQDAISDIESIRSGAAAGATALQELPEHTHADEEITMSDFDVNLREFAQMALSGVNDLSDAVADLGSAVSDMNTALGSKLSDAPSDGKQYARQSGSWAEVQGGGGGGAEPKLIATITGQDGDTGLAVTGLVGKKHLAAYIMNTRGSDIPAWLCFTVNGRTQYIVNSALANYKQMGILIDVFGSRAHFECNVAQGYAYYDTASRGNDVYSGWLQDRTIFENGITNFKFHTSGNADLAGLYMEVYAW